MAKLAWKFSDGTKQLDMMYVLHEAWEHGSGYWARFANKKCFNDEGFNILQSATIEEYDENTGQTLFRKDVSFEDLYNIGFPRYLEHFKKPFPVDSYDCVDADVLLQLTILNEVRYG